MGVSVLGSGGLSPPIPCPDGILPSKSSATATKNGTVLSKSDLIRQIRVAGSNRRPVRL